ncbi:MAG: DegQ family serine endoprotease [Rhodocyclaceae bacterium]|nr:DegQ family serine endoprotease [Rhodocyclaceae bacterium]
MSKRLFVSFLLIVFPLFAAAQAKELPDFTDLVEKQGPAVVNISTTQIVKQNRMMPQFPFDEDDPAFDMFRRFMPHSMPNTPPHEFKNQSLGSGFIISADGLILTNAHVVEGADEVLVRLTDKREFKAKVLGADLRTDVALIRIDANGLPVVKIGDPNRLRVGEWVIAIGSPFGFDASVTAGIVSAKGRALPQENYVPFIQTDVAINPGNSGGPLFNMKGEVVGINSQIYSRSGGYQGIAFAIPIDVAMDIQAQLKASGHVSRGRLGVVIQEVTKELADSFGLQKPVGALVTSVEKGSPAEKAGIVAGDIILKFDGKTVNQSSDLPRIVGATRPGNKSVMQVWRKGATKDMAIAVGEMQEDKVAARGARQGKPADAATVNKLGLVLVEPTAEQRRQLGIPNGLVVEDVRNGGMRTDLRSGDIILALIDKGVQSEIKTVDQFNGLIAKLDKSSTITLLVRRGEGQTFITIKGVGDK